jgi:hypothetical protein
VADENVLREIADLLARRKSRIEMIGEFLREIAVLLVVFVPLDAAFNPGTLRWWQIASISMLALGVGYLGMWLEEKQWTH